MGSGQVSSVLLCAPGSRASAAAPLREGFWIHCAVIKHFSVSGVLGRAVWVDRRRDDPSGQRINDSLLTGVVCARVGGTLDVRWAGNVAARSTSPALHSGFFVTGFQ